MIQRTPEHTQFSDNKTETPIEMLDVRQVLDYEVRSSWWACSINNNWLQNMVGKYFAYKVRRKYKRYKYSYDLNEEMKKKNEHVESK